MIMHIWVKIQDKLILLRKGPYSTKEKEDL